MGTDFYCKTGTSKFGRSECESEYANFVAAMKSELVNAEKNIYFLQIGINPLDLAPAAGSCAIDHSTIDWSTIDLTGGFGSYAELSYDDDGYYGINFYKADNSTPLGLFDSCTSTGFTADGNYFGNLWTATYLVPDAANSGSSKTVLGSYWAFGSEPVRSTNLDTAYCFFPVSCWHPASVIWHSFAANDLYNTG